jgi:hypothetical protein
MLVTLAALFFQAAPASAQGLAYSTFLGGASTDQGSGIAVDGAGNAYVTGWTVSADFPTTPGAFDTTAAGADAFVTKLNPAGSALVYSTYLGGASTDQGSGIAVDGAGNAYVTGFTFSADFPTTPGAFDTTFNPGTFDAFVTKLNPAGSALVYSTYLGGASTDQGFGIAVDGAGNAYVTGLTVSADFPTTPGAFDTTFNGGGDAFMTKLNPAGSALVYSTYLGGASNDQGSGIAVDGAGNAYVTGSTFSADFPTTPGAFDTTFNGSIDAFVTKFAIAPPESTPGKVTGGGQIESDPVFSPFGDLLSVPALVPSAASPTAKATFGFSVRCCAPKGNLEYNDHDADVRIKALSIDGLFISGPGSSCPATPGSKHATFTGTASVIRSTGTTTEPYTVDVDDCGEPGTADTFGIQTTTYSNGPSVLIGGNIQIRED